MRVRRNMPTRTEDGHMNRLPLFQISVCLLLFLLSSQVQAQVVRVDGITPNVGSVNGATRITINGQGFAKNQFNFGTGQTHLGNEVSLVSATRSYTCDVHKDGTHETQIMCYTRPMPYDTYYVRVSVDGEKVPLDRLCRHPTDSRCRFRPLNKRTPKIYSVTPQSGPPGTLLNIRGVLFTSRYGSNEAESQNGREEQIKRVYFGGQNCELLRDDQPDVLYGITLDNENSNWGNLICKLKGSYVGNINGSIIVEGAFGRTQPELGSLRVTGQDKIAMFQTYAEVSSVTPSTGSLEGGTLLTITGVNLDETDAPAKVSVAGVECKVKSVEDTKITCLTGPEPGTSPIYPGSRGLTFEIWFGQEHLSADWEQILNYTAPDMSDVIDEAYFLETNNTWNRYVTRMRGFFVPPADSDYRFLIRSDDSSALYLSSDDDPANKMKIAYTDYHTYSYYKYPSQISAPLSLKKGKHYYMEASHKEIGGGSNVRVAAKMYSTSLPGGLASNVKRERQRISTTSESSPEIQTFRRNDWKTQAHTHEVQEVTVNTDNPADTSFRLCLHSVCTASMLGSISASNVKRALDVVPSIAPDRVSVTRTDTAGGFKLAITFESEMGDFPDLVPETADDNRATVTFSVTEVTKGKPSLNYFAFDFGGVPSPRIAKDASVSKIKTAVEEMLQVRCPSSLLRPSGRAYIQDYEESTDYLESGKRTRHEEAFCGEYSSKNPSFLFASNEKLSPVPLNMYRQFCMAYKGNLLDTIRLEYSYLDGAQEKTAGDYFGTPLPESAEWSYVCINLLELVTQRRPTATQPKLTRLWIYKNGTDDHYVDLVFLGANEPTTDFVGAATKQRLRNPYARAQAVEVADLGSDEIQISIQAFECAHNLPLLGVLHATVQWNESTIDYTTVTTPSAMNTTLLQTTEGVTVTSVSPSLGSSSPEGTESSHSQDATSMLIEATSSSRMKDFAETTAYPSTRIEGNPSTEAYGNDLTGTDMNPSTVTSGNPWTVANGHFSTITNGNPSTETIGNPSTMGNGLPLMATTTGSPTTTMLKSILANGGTYTGTNWPAGVSATTTRVKPAAPPVGGTFSVTYKGNTVANIPADVEEDALKKQLESLQGIGFLSVTRNGLCSGYDWEITWLTAPGNQPDFEVDGSSLTGPSANITVTTLENGGVLFDPIPGDLLRTSHEMPQVHVTINNIPTKCTGTCSFEWQASATPSITSLSTDNGVDGDTLTIAGTGFSTTPGDNLVLMGGVNCSVTAATATQLTCTVGEGPAGEHNFSVTVDQKGLAKHDGGPFTFTYNYAVTGISPTSGSLGGGTLITISGSGFGSAVAIAVGGAPCQIRSTVYNDIVCSTPSTATAAAVDVVVTEGSRTVTSPQQFTYDAAKTPSITSLSTTTADVQGGTALTILGSGFGADTNSSQGVHIGGVDTEIVSYADNQVEVVLPSLAPGSYSVQLDVMSQGFADLRLNNIQDINYPLKVTNVYPRKGSAEGGTKVILTGEGFGDNKTALEIMMGDKECVVDTVTSTKITCITSRAGDTHLVDNYGTHPTYGKGYAWSEPNLEIKVGDVVEWRWGLNDLITDINFRIEETAGPTTDGYNDVGFRSSDVSTPAGVYKYQFTQAGTYYYWSGYVDTNGLIALRGVVTVRERTASHEYLSLKLAGHEALYDPSSGVADPTETGCVGTYSALPGCTDPTPSGLDASKFDFTYTTCLMASVTGISPTSGTASDPVTITGTGFTSTICQNEVYVGDQRCVVSAASTTSLTCTVDGGNTLSVGVLHPVRVVVTNRGAALMDIRKDAERSFALLPSVTAVSPTTGSTNGGTLLTITGDGFSEGVSTTSVSLGSVPCTVHNVTYQEVICETTQAWVHSAAVTVTVGSVPSSCKGSCDFMFATASTPVLTSVSPSSIAAASATLNLTGTGFGTLQPGTMVKVGDDSCIPSSVTDTQIVCDIASAVVGSQPLRVLIADKGYATYEAGTIPVDPLLSSVNPVEGGINGGTKITIVGNGFKTDDTSVTVAGKQCDVESVTSNQVVCITPANDAVAVKITVTSNGVTYPQLDYTYTTVLTPSVSSISPTNGNPGEGVQVNGAGFGTTQSVVKVTIGDTECTVLSVTDSTITCTLGAHAGGTYDVIVDIFSKGRATSTIQFTYDLTVTSITPSSGSFAGDQTITLVGTGFSGNTDITICGNTCQVTSATPTNLHCTTPPNAGSGSQACDVIVTEGVANVTKSSAYTYESSLTPDITNVSPRRGGTGGGVRLTITGTGFGTSKADTSVTIAGTECIVDTVTNTEIQCVTEPRTPSIKTKIRVEIASSGIARQDNADFEYVDLWSSRWSWGGNPPPEKGDLVVIPKDMTMVLDVDTPVIKMLLIQGGTLMFDEKHDITLNCENVLVTDNGTFQIGTEDAPHMYRATVMLHGNLRSKELPIYGTKTLAIREGTLDLHGKPAEPVWTKLGSTANAGSNTITLQVPVNWQVGDQIVIATTGERHSQRENEQHEIAAISADKTTLTLTKALAFKHLGETIPISAGVNLEARAEVGLLTRNVVVRGSDNMEWHDKIEACPEGFNTGEFATQTCFQGRFGEEMGADQFGSQIMMHAPRKDENLVVGRISNIETTYAGQAFRLGRYAIHFHLNGNMNGSYVKNSAIHRSFNRAVNIHGTHHVNIENNVAYDIMGGAFFLEDGVETNNIFQKNLAVFVKSSTSLQNDDITPAAFWVTNPNNIVRENHAVGGTHFGFWYRMHTHPDGPSFDPKICPKNVPLGTFENNVAHSQGWFGIWIFQDYFPKKGGTCSATEPEGANFRTLTTWNSEKGAEGVNCGAVRFVDFFMVNNEKAGIEFKKGKGKMYDPDDGAMVKGGIIAAKPAASHSGVLDENPTGVGIILPYSQGFQVEDVTFINFDQSNTAAFGLTQIDGTTQDNNGGFTYRTSGLSWVNSPNKAKWRWQNEAVLYDLDSTLTGITEGKAVPTSPILPPSCTQQAAFSLGQPGSVCPADVSFHRWSWNHPTPKSLLYKMVNFTNQYGTVQSPYKPKRVTHKEGWMVLLVSKDTYVMTWDNAAHITNISYSGVSYEFAPDEYLIMGHDFYHKPDRFNVVPGGGEKSAAPLSFANNYHGDYYFDDNTNKFTYMLSGKTRSKRAIADPTTLSNKNVQMRVYRCYYEDCIEPVDPGTVPPTTKRPDNAVFWSDKETWKDAEAGWGGNYGNGDYGPPLEGDNVKILKDQWVVLDVTPPDLGKIYIYGVLEFESAKNLDLALTSTHIFIAGGRLIVGWEDAPLLGSAQLIMRGDHRTPEFLLPNGPNMGAKAIGVFGGLDMHGQNTTTSWTRLATSSLAGAGAVTLETAVDWSVGDSVVIAPSRFDAHQTEVKSITAISGDKRTLTLDSALSFDHLVTTQALNSAGTKTVTMAAEIGLLTRNVKVIGEAYADQQKEAFGARVIVGTFNQDGNEFTGYARLSNVEFERTGQEGFIDFYDPRYSLAWLSTGTVSDVKPSYVRSCAFHHGYMTAIGAFGANQLEITDNVVYETVYSGMIIGGDNNRVRRNLVTKVLHPGTYNGRQEPDSLVWAAGIKVIDATNVVLQDNVVGSSERAGYHIHGEPCPGAANTAEPWSNNVAHSGMVGVVSFSTDGLPGCSMITNFTVYKMFDYGIYTQIEASIEFTGNILVDNNLGFFPFVIKPPSESHQFANKYIKISKSYFVGKSSAWDCTNDVFPNNLNLQFSEQARSFKTATGGTVGIGWGTFGSASNKAPKKPWTGIMSYQALYGETTISDITFINYGTSCGARDACLTPNPSNDDCQHPVYSNRITFVNVDTDSKVQYPRPTTGTINPADCVDMNCDGLKKTLLKDMDGSYLGSVGAIIPESEWQWDGDRRYGLGDYRIPKVALTYLNGSRIPVNEKMPHKGVIRDSSCVKKAAYQAYECHGLDYELLHVESMDKDTETRRVSPIAIIGDGYVDLINGPQDHGWCAGYTCQKRLSTFPVLVATGKTYEFYYTGTSPQHTKFHLMNSDTSQAIVLSIFYERPNRLDVYKNGLYQVPENAGLDTQGRQTAQILNPPTYPGQYIPDVGSQQSGTNYFHRESQMLYVLIRGDTPIEVKQAPLIVVTFKLPAMTVDEFFGEKIIRNLALFLDIPPEKIKIAKVVRADGRRRRRAATTDITFEIGNEPSSTIDSTSPDDLSADDLQQATSKLVTGTQTNNISSAVFENNTVVGLQVQEPLPPSGSDAWSQMTEGGGDGSSAAVDVQMPRQMDLVTQPVPLQEGAAFATQPKLKIVDDNGDPVLLLGSTQYPWQVTATLHTTAQSDPRAVLLGTTTISFVKGWANFTDLGVSHSGAGYRLEFKVTYPAEAGSTYIRVSEYFTVRVRELSAKVVAQPTQVTVNEAFTMQVAITDALTEEVVADIAWKNHTWECTPSLHMAEIASGQLSGKVATPVDPATNRAVFSSLALSTPERYFLSFRCLSTPAQYDVTAVSAAVDVFPAGYNAPLVSKRKAVTLTFDGDFYKVAQGKEGMFGAAVVNKLRPKSGNVTYENVTVSAGSILVAFLIGGSSNDVDSATYLIWDEIKSPLTLNFSGHAVTAKNIMHVDGEEFYGNDGKPEAVPGGMSVAVIVAIAVVCSVVVIGTIIAIIVWKLKCGDQGGKKLGRVSPGFSDARNTVVIMDAGQEEGHTGGEEHRYKVEGRAGSANSGSANSSDSGMMVKNVPPPATMLKENSWIKKSPRVSPSQSPMPAAPDQKQLYGTPALPPIRTRNTPSQAQPEDTQIPGLFRRQSSTFMLPRIDTVHDKKKPADVSK